jgi:diacylglycerol kinase (ATP)
MKNRPFYERLSFALNGLSAAWRRERSFRFQVAAALLVVIFLVLFRPPLVWWAIIVMMIGLVLAAELLNSALEALVDHLHPQFHPEIRFIKDVAAGGVLLLSLCAIIIGLLLIATLL